MVVIIWLFYGGLCYSWYFSGHETNMNRQQELLSMAEEVEQPQQIPGFMSCARGVEMKAS